MRCYCIIPLCIHVDICIHIQPLTSNKGSTTSISSKKSITREEFEDFCDGADDPVLRFLDEELALQAAQPRATSLRSSVTVKYENTYRTEPTYKFFPDKVSSIIQDVLSQGLDGMVYDFHRSSQLACEFSMQIKGKVKYEMDFPRHKLVCFVVIGERKDQGVFVGSRCVWNEKFDGFASSSFKNDTIFAIGVLYAVFLE